MDKKIVDSPNVVIDKPKIQIKEKIVKDQIRRGWDQKEKDRLYSLGHKTTPSIRSTDPLSEVPVIPVDPPIPRPDKDPKGY